MSDVGFAAPDTNPSASPSFTIIVAKYLVFFFKMSFAPSNVIPLFFLSSYRSFEYLLSFSDVKGLITFAPSKFILFSFAFSSIFSGSPTKIMFANPSFIIFSLAFSTLKSSASGSTIVFMSCFDFCFIFSIKVIFIFPPISSWLLPVTLYIENAKSTSEFLAILHSSHYNIF